MEFKLNFSKSKVKKNPNKKYQLVKNGAVGVVGITSTASYFVDINNKQYQFTIDSYDIKGKSIFYARELQNNKSVNVIRLNKININNRKYIPFAVGSIVKGNIYLINGVERFQFKRLFDADEMESELAQTLIFKQKEFKKFYRDNYNIIKQCMD